MNRCGVGLLSFVFALSALAACGGDPAVPAVDGGPPFDSGPPGCSRDTDCADSVDCTTDICVTATRTCRHVLTPALCAAGESCNPRTGCEAGRACAIDIDCADMDACTATERCDPASRVCTYRPLDGDGDGDPPRVCGGDDCDDSRDTVYLGAIELCDGIDNDCDGAIDEGGTDTCGALEVCIAGTCECEATATRCGGRCTDLTIDASNCGDCYSSCGAGTCASSSCVCAGGLTSCIAAGGGSYCVDTSNDAENCGGCGVVTPGAPRAETCNGIDDDCDGAIDDGNPEGGACVNGVGACARTGVRICSGGVLRACDATAGSPTAEICNGGIDDDCDGAADLADGVCVPCPPGYTGFDGSCTDVDECATGAPCGAAAGATCANAPAGSYTCVCPIGYRAPAMGGTCTDIDECAEGTCGLGVTGCVNSAGGYMCTCAAGYTVAGAGAPCIDIDECAVGTPCGVGLGTCVNVPGTYACMCNAGYEAVPATGGMCVDIDECDRGTCGGGMSTCVNSVGSYVCTCNAGYTVAPGSGAPCVDIDECTTATHDCDTSPLATCTNAAGSFTCTCPSGWANASAGHGASGCAATRFTDLLNGTVRDNANGAVWQQVVPVSAHTQAGAVAYCASLVLDGGGWRLPTRDELVSIVDTTRINPAIDPTYFPTYGTYFWSSSPAGGSPPRGWVVYFATGDVTSASTAFGAFARCVR